MEKKLLTLSLLAFSLASVEAQNITSYFGPNAQVYVSKATLYYNGGGMETAATGVVENHGDVMVEAASGDAFNVASGGQFILKLNEPGSFGDAPPVDNTTAPTFTYGQLYINGIAQTDIAGTVQKEYRNIAHGDYQQIGLPFYQKTLSDLNTELGKTFNTSRWSQNEILIWNNANVVFDNLGSLSDKTAEAGAYYVLGAGDPINLDLQTITRTLTGTPYSDLGADVTKSLSGAGTGINFGSGGNNNNAYNEKYNTYLQDAFAVANGFTWTGNYGKNIYQFSNPFFTNLDLSTLATAIPNLIGIRLEETNVEYIPNVGSGTADVGAQKGYKFVTKSGNAFVGDTAYLSVRPLGTFALKLSSGGGTINLADLRRFAYYKDNADTGGVTPQALSARPIQGGLHPLSASRAVKAQQGDNKELILVGLDSAGNELARTYVVYSPFGVTGTSGQSNEAVRTSNDFGTFEEKAVEGGYGDVNRFLYINAINDADFIGKPLMWVNYSNKIKKTKFLIRVNGDILPAGASTLPDGQQMYYKGPNGDLHLIKSGDEMTLAPIAAETYGTEYELYYGEPELGTLGVDELQEAQKTLVVYDKAARNYVVHFAPDWKSAEVSVYDMSGRMVHYAKKVNATQNYTLPLNAKQHAVFIVKAKNQAGKVVTSKIVTQ